MLTSSAIALLLGVLTWVPPCLCGPFAFPHVTEVQGTTVARPDPEPVGGPAVLRIDGGGWRVQASAAELGAHLVEDGRGRFGVEVKLTPRAAEGLRAVTIVGQGATVTLRICGAVVGRPIMREPILDGLLVIMGAPTRAEAEIWMANLVGARPCSGSGGGT